ncbi:MAG: hypothetical protein WC273_01530 [Dehalococcoidia bacterium]
MIQGDGFDADAFLAFAAASAREDVLALLRRWIERGRASGALLAAGDDAASPVVARYVLEGQLVTVWTATPLGASGAPEIQLRITDLLARVPAQDFDEIVGRFEAIPVIRTGLAEARAEGRDRATIVIMARELLAHPDHAELLLDAIDRAVTSGPDALGPFRAFMSPYQWGERGEHGG